MHKAFYGKLLLLFLVSGFVLFALRHWVESPWISAHYWYIDGYFLVLSGVSYALVRKGMQGDALDFQNFFLSSVTIRLLVSAGVLGAYFYLVGENNKGFLVTFFLFYLMYTGFEIKTLLANLRPHSEK